jgi:hypothetical protein
MCIAILNRKATLTKKTFRNCWDANPDGAGLCYFDGERVQIFKELKSYKLFFNEYSNVRKKFPDIDIAIHFRIATHGRVNLTNCHPFRINKRAGFIHNGMINNLERSADFSDTYLFNETILKKLPANFTNNGALLELIGGYIGASKLVIINGPVSVIVNEDFGHWDGGNWYSNKSYQDRPVYKAAPKVTTHKSADAYTWKPAKNYSLWGGSEYFEDDFVQVNDTRAAASCECCREETDAASYNYEYNLFMCGKCIKECEGW